MKFGSAIFAFLLLFPSLAFGAGFAKQSLFLSKTPVTEGETVLVHAVVQNDSSVQFVGVLVFSAQEGTGSKLKIGEVAVTMAAGGAQAASVSWKPSAGEYTVTAALTLKDGTITDSQSAHFTINKKSEPAAENATTTFNGNIPIQSSAEVQAMIAKYVPASGGFIAPAFAAVDTLRNQIGGLLDRGINWSKSKTGGRSAGQILGASTNKAALAPSALVQTGTSIFAIATLYILSLFKWVLANPGIFYAALMLGFLFALWKLFSRIRRPQY